MDDRFHLQRFVDAQQPVYTAVLGELRAGRKRSHWMWFIFPQISGLGHSVTSQTFAVSSLAEAVAYLAHPTLGPRLRECAALVVADVLKREGFNARISGIDTEIDNADTVCVCFVEEVSTGRAAFTARKFSRRAAGANVIICRLGKAEGTSSDKVDEAAPQSLEEIVAEVSKSVGLRDRREI